MLTYSNGIRILMRMRFDQEHPDTVKKMLWHWYKMDGGMTETTYHRLMAFVCEYYESRKS